MDGALDLFAQPAFVAGSSALLVVLALAAFYFFWRSGRERVARDTALEQERLLRQQFEAVMTSSRDGIMILTRTGDVALMSDVAAGILGLNAADTTGLPLSRLPLRCVDQHHRPLLGRDAFALTEEGRPRIIGVPGRRGPDDIRWLHIKADQVEQAPHGQPVTVVTIMDTTGLREAAEALNRSDAQFRRAMENAPTGMALVDLEWRLMEVNRAFAEMMGHTVAALRGTPFSALSHPQDIQAERDQLERLYEGYQSHFSLEKRYVRTDGNVVWAVLDVGLVRYAGGAPDHYVVQLRDTTDDRMHSELLAHRAMHDPLTGLANRTLLHEVLENLLAQPDADGRVGVIAVDLDGFKGLNDRFGHATGDSALVHVAGILRAATGGSGTVARIGGDEFVIAVQDPDCSKALFDIAASIHEGLKRPLAVKRHQIQLGASIGIAMADDDSLAGGSATLLSAADAAMYRAKAAGKSRTEVFEASMRTSHDSQSALGAELARAIEHGDLVLHYQPILELATRSVVGYEALVRWQHPTRGLLLPGAFLPLIEDKGLAVTLGAALVEQASQFLARHPSESTWVSLNVSADQLGDSEFADRVLSAIGRHHLTPQRIVVELTEASLVAPNTRIRHELTELRNAGVPILLDDFGTGVSPLSYLRDLPVSGVKLDMSFVAGIPEDPSGAKVSRALGALARELGLATIAEGIETEAQAEFLGRCGWRYGQGWLFGVAQPGAAVIAAHSRLSTSLIDPNPRETGELDLKGLGG
ncbi:putative bifunctional diguanylate cyclase/phosphodiesterase [Demequina lignilytica]|uniref:EAL domain-containing protein n=1 Tax=Demequina lignilytica TaxID=3051663 RepID=A0AAW7M7V7_9MICO|nr:MULTISPECIES: EAL domain-containing protein [unclassified Demequina]MDN4477152.1 EAL domain-containing protein [Demequina sp. SYSU T00039-1]MDN4484000.1 EAL domain-containing protein [Demequina sp. SYSU T0a273]MDN4487325.1 EAL domain-containing protein [Demequina sp. SYSU T00039]MDN4491078.1 EAL domain-containing protein [Demequina sp. SYSU T00068]